jgi:hypothetical protein
VELGVSFRTTNEFSARDIMGPSVFSSLTLPNQPSAIGNNFYEALTEGKPQVSIPIVHKHSVAVAQKANLQQNDLSNTGALRAQVNQTKSTFLETMNDAKMEAGRAIMDTAKANGINTGHVANALFPNKPCEAVNFLLACDPTCIGTIWSTVSNVTAQCSNKEIAIVLEQALKTLHEASKSKEGKAPKSPVSWDKFETGDLKRFLAADPMKQDNTGKQIAAVEQSIVEMERNQGDLEANYTSTGDVYEKVKNELDQSLVAELIAPRRCAAEVIMLAETLPALKGLAPKKEDVPDLREIEEVKKKLMEAAPKPDPEPSGLKRLLDPLAEFNPFRKAA